MDAGADHLALRFGIQAAGVDDPQLRAEVVGFAVAAIAREVRRVVDQRGPAADQPVEQRRLADVRPPDDRDQRGRHDVYPSFTSSLAACDHSSMTLTNNVRCTGLPSASATAARAAMPSSFTRWPPRPTTIGFCESRSTMMIAPIATSPLRSVQVSICTAEAYGSSLPSW